MYFTPQLQQRVLGLFAFALRPGGLLMLGSAETLNRKTPGFRDANSAQRIFARTADAAALLRMAPFVPLSTNHAPSTPQARAGAAHGDDLQRRVEMLEALVRFTHTPFLVLDADRRVIQVVGDVSKYCQVAEGPMTGSIGSLLRPELRDEARALLLLTHAGAGPLSGQSVALPDVEGAVRLVASPVPVGGDTYCVLSFEPVSPGLATSPPGAGRSEDFDRTLNLLEQELLANRDALRRSLEEMQALNEALQASSEELQASTEELQASNEELQASNEELQATNEELQASNEELGSLNRELGQRGENLHVLNLDLENIQASLSQGMVIVNRELEVTRYSPLAVRVFALMETDLGRPLLAAPTTLEIPGFEVALRDVAGGAPRRSIEAGDANVSYLVQVLPYRSPSGGRLGAIITLTDVTELVALRAAASQALDELSQKSELLEHQAAFDAVTGLLNRRYFTELLEREVARAQRGGGRLALAWMDLDKFKEINDEHGHEAGDVALRTIGERVLTHVRGSDFVGRLGGDEIGILIAGYATHAELDSILDRLVGAARDSIDVDGHGVCVSTSIGVALFPEDAPTAKDLLRASDAAMYAVKRKSGDAYTYFDQSMNAASDVRRARRLEISEAIENREFEMHYQPVVGADSNELWGVEALVRWRRESGVVSAADFVPFCEESGQIRALGVLTVDLLRQDVRTLRAAGHAELRVAFNMSVTQLEDRQFAAVVEAEGVPGALGGVVIEILESVFLPDHPQALRLLDTLAELGAEVSIDDYGSGYSNVRLLESLNPDYIKLDRTFLSEQHGRDGRSALIRSAVAVSHVVGARVIAEGIEDDWQRDLVREAGADFVQGYGIAMPMPLPDLLDWIRDHPELVVGRAGHPAGPRPGTG